MESTPIDPYISGLLDHVRALWADSVNEYVNERDKKFAQIGWSCMPWIGRAQNRAEVLTELLSREIKSRIGIYRKMAEEHSAPQMFGKTPLSEIRSDLTKFVELSRKSLLDRTAREGHASGDYDPNLFAVLGPDLERRIDANMCDVINSVLRVLETLPLPSERQPAALATIVDTQPRPELTPEEPPSRRHQVNTFLGECSVVAQRPIYRRHIWLSVGHSKGRQFEYWQAGDKRATHADDLNFGRVLKMSPAEFVSQLHQNRLLPGS